MVFSSSTFLFLFLPIVLAIYYLLHPRFRNQFLLIASLAFYAFGEPRFVLVMLCSIAGNYLLALLISVSKRKGIKKLWLIIGICGNIGLLVTFKYLNFITLNLKRVLPAVNVTSIALPIGVSFFTFQAMSYVIDVYRGEKVQKNPLNLGLYISFFPQLIAGPIVRYNTISEAIRNRQIKWDDFSEGIVVFLNGLGKKIIFANNMAIIADHAFSTDLTQQSVLFSWLGALAYALQIYFDFSGYSDMAIGLGRLFGFHFSKNFNYPYIANSVTDFWRRWHISLGTWFRDYVYIPLGGSRQGARIHIRNLLIIWLITGIWHGANWTFIIWGLIWFFVLIIEKYCIKPERFRTKCIAWIYRVFVFILVLFGWVLFRSDTARMAWHYLKSMFGLYGNPIIDNNWLWYSREYLMLLILAAVLSTPLIRKMLLVVKKKMRPVVFETIKGIGYIVLLFICISYLVTGAHNPFIYFNF